ncbi:RETRotransposonlike family member [Acanthamoeba castellanii str. Neff]|uniref:RETRotransposonlike family member n=1 Tax=Acanthamoeba castellanii (strain ATCC 30010 / Neff) TaxID=1257118 RepID=L8GVL1_ACACF|nr:RETRotransposonlike family member [Acanthamoeba castellanii str. Neff]ELR17279.1 RETRotransposonlike family member [Acanthamoeba castellanii str. Neff]
MQKTKIRKTLGAGVMHPSHSPWVLLVVLVTKKDRLTQFCINYHGLNQVMKWDSYPLPHVDDILNMLVGSVWRLSLNLILGYWQILVHEDDIKKTVFVTWHGTFEFMVMLFGLTNVLASFQRDMDIILSGLNWVSTLVYINDIIVFSVSFEDHLQHLQEVFNWLCTANMFVKPSKCNFCQTKLLFLGHLVQKDGIAMDPEKVHIVHEMAQPVNTTEV